jgi:hypothetical protein
MSQEESVESDMPLACRLSSPELGARAAELRQEIFTAVEDQRDLAQGYAFRFPGTADWILRLGAFMATEHECCPFFRFELVVEPDSGPLWLILTGPAGTKEFIAATFL